MEKQPGFDIEIYYNGVNWHEIEAIQEKELCQYTGQSYYNKLRPLWRELDLYGGIRLDITTFEKQGDRQGFQIDVDWKSVPEEIQIKCEQNRD